MSDGSKSKNPLELLLDELTQTNAKTSATNIDFSKLLRVNDRRKTERNKVTGSAVLLDEQGRHLTKAVLRNITPSGLGLETHPVRLNTGASLLIELGGEGAHFGRLKCVVVWVKDIEESSQKNKMVGIEFSDTSESFKQNFNKFINILSKKK